jgi:hypothetical protein
MIFLISVMVLHFVVLANLVKERRPIIAAVVGREAS